MSQEWKKAKRNEVFGFSGCMVLRDEDDEIFAMSWPFTDLVDGKEVASGWRWHHLPSDRRGDASSEAEAYAGPAADRLTGYAD